MRAAITELVPDAVRATLLSITALLSGLALGVCNPLIGRGISLLSLSGAALGLAVILAAIAIVGALLSQYAVKRQTGDAS